MFSLVIELSLSHDSFFEQMLTNSSEEEIARGAWEGGEGVWGGRELDGKVPESI